MLLHPTWLIMTSDFATRITQLDYQMRLLELQMASLAPTPPQEIKAAQHKDILKQIKEETEVTINIPDLNAMIKNIYGARIDQLESQVQSLIEVVGDLKKQISNQGTTPTNHNPFFW